MIFPVIVLLALISSPACAYGGPGVAIALLGSIFGFAGVIAGAIFFAVLYPAIWVYRKYRDRKEDKELKALKDGKDSKTP